ncbi:MAG: hypothetical protein CSA44_03150 [Gammaproteobacteria bacterium]|nr:MAG: hypothetical protein CSA44_03150 [Gammaproteobacteria bacterium]
MNGKSINRNSQQGIALLATVLIITIFAIMGMMNAQKAKESEKLAGANVRYDTVFEAAERSLRDAGDYLLRIGVPYADNGSKGRSNVANFDISALTSDLLVKLTSHPNWAIVWFRDTLRTTVCGGSGCQSGIDFVARLDDGLWKNQAIQSVFNSAGCPTPGTDEVACNNYLRDIQTYTLIELLAVMESGGIDAGPSNVKGASLTSVPEEAYYLITVKASGFPPGTTNTTALNSRENVILQGVFARL